MSRMLSHQKSPFLLAFGGVEDRPAASRRVVNGRLLPGSGGGGDNKGTILGSAFRRQGTILCRPPIPC